jgi:hypothetical protein
MGADWFTRRAGSCRLKNTNQPEFDMGKSGEVVKYGSAARYPSVMAVGTGGQTLQGEQDSPSAGVSATNAGKI